MRLKKKSKLIYFTILACCVIAGLALILTNFRDNIVFFYSPTEITTLSNHNLSNIRIGGMVKDGSIKKDGNFIKFVVTDFKNEIIVKYQGALPNLFREGQGVVARGAFQNNVFAAEEILAKHDEKYMPKEVAYAIKSK